MPSAYALYYAIPLCFARRMLRDGQHGLHFTCYRPLSYDALENLWHCVTCGHSISAEHVVARSSPYGA